MLTQLKQELDELPEVAISEDLNMTDLLCCPPGLLKLLVWMVRQKSAGVKKVAAFIQADAYETAGLLDAMAAKGLVNCLPLEQGEKQYRVDIHTSRNYRIPSDIWDVVDDL